MLWFFERDDESLKLETRCDNDTSESVVIVRHPDGREHTAVYRWRRVWCVARDVRAKPRTSALDSPRWARDHARRLAEQATHMTAIQRLWTFALDYSRARRSLEWKMAVR